MFIFNGHFLWPFFILLLRLPYRVSGRVCVWWGVSGKALILGNKRKNKIRPDTRWQDKTEQGTWWQNRSTTGLGWKWRTTSWRCCCPRVRVRVRVWVRDRIMVRVRIAFYPTFLSSILLTRANMRETTAKLKRTEVHRPGCKTRHDNKKTRQDNNKTRQDNNKRRQDKTRQQQDKTRQQQDKTNQRTRRLDRSTHDQKVPCFMSLRCIACSTPACWDTKAKSSRDVVLLKGQDQKR